MELHKELKDKLLKNHLISPIDKITACGKHGFIDLPFTTLDKRLTINSKYYIAINIDNNPVILSHPNLYNLRKEIDEKMIKKNYFSGYDKKRNRVLLHYENDGIFKIGNKHGHEKFLTKFDICDFHLLAKRSNYRFFIECLSSKDKHRAIQILICELGLSLGFKIKVARNDLTPICSSIYSSDIKDNLLTIKDLNLNDIEEVYVNDIDLIDVLWLDKTTDNIFAAFEVELSKNYDSVLRRFSNIKNPNTYLICVGNDYFNFKNKLNNNMFYHWFNSKNLNYLELDSLFSMLNETKKYGNAIQLNLFLKYNLINLFAH